jgi:5-oxoprolinase (ATP-hydrolysing) subunit C
MSLILNTTHPGVTLQDLGRKKARELGYSKGGPLDELSYRWANYLLGNPSTTPVLEIVLGGLEMELTLDAHLSLTGADLGIETNKGVPLFPGKTWFLPKGTILISKGPRMGQVAYIGIEGGFKRQKFLESVSIPKREKVIFPRINETLFEYDECSRSGSKMIPDQFRIVERQFDRIPYFPAYQNNDFSSEKVELVKEERFDRMGAYLSASGLHYKGDQLSSEPIAIGSLQVVNPKKVIALLNDCQTVGGYPKLGVLSALGKSILVQMKPGKKFRLESISPKEAFDNYWSSLAFLT